MSSVLLPKKRVFEIFKGLMAYYKLVAPVRKDGILLFQEITSAEDVVLSDEITYKSPKEFLFPQIEKLMVFNENGEVQNIEPSQKTVIFGVKPCDLEAIKILTSVFTHGKYKDPYFENRLNNTVLIGMACVSKKPGCFCEERGIYNGYSKECDIFLTDIGEEYIAKIFTNKGEKLLEKFQLEQVEWSPDNSTNSTNVPLEINEDENELFDKIDWEKISEKCLACGTCTYICPTCHCFGFKDSTQNGETIRYRYWDSCMYPKFTLHASGHNPRLSKKERYRQRILHKYVYVKKNFGYTACTGCGRCIRSCPAGMDINSVVKEINETLKSI